MALLCHPATTSAAEESKRATNHERVPGGRIVMGIWIPTDPTLVCSYSESARCALTLRLPFPKMPMKEEVVRNGSFR